MDDRGKLFHATLGRGRAWLVLIWIVLRSLDGAIFFLVREPGAVQLPIFLLSDIIWTTAMLVALGCRQAWARFGLIAIVALGIAWDVIHIAQQPSSNLWLFAVDALVRAGVVLFACRSWDIKRLTSRAYE